LINLGIITPNVSDACSWYRTLGPWNAFRKQFKNVNLVIPSRVDWSSAGQIDVAYMQRPFLPEHATTAMILAKSGVPLWIDFDDDLWDVPQWNPASKHFRNEQCGQVLKEVSQWAHTITATTADLASAIADRTGKQVVVVPNALHDRYPLRQPNPDKLIFWWRGGKQHRNDHHMTAVLFDEAAKVPGAEFWVIGDDPFWTDRLPTGTVTVVPDALDVVFYHETLLAKNPSILLYGLENCHFNRAKSSCSWLEATMAGSIVVGPRWQEWERPGILHYEPGDEESARAAVRLAVEANRGELWKQAAQHLSQHYRLSVVNSRRFNVLRSIVGAS